MERASLSREKSITHFDQSMGAVLDIKNFKEGHKHMVSCDKVAVSCVSREHELLMAVTAGSCSELFYNTKGQYSKDKFINLHITTEQNSLLLYKYQIAECTVFVYIYNIIAVSHLLYITVSITCRF